MCSVCPLRRYIVRPAAYRAAGDQSPKASTQTSPPRGAASKRRPNIDNVDNMNTDGRRVEAIRYENNRPRPTNRERPKRRRERRGCSVHTARPNIDNVDNRPAVWRRRGRPRAVLLPRVQRLPFRWTYHKPAPFSCSRRRKPPPAPPRGAASTHPAPNIDNVDNMDTTARRVETTQARGGEYRKSKRPPPTNRERPKPQIKNERPKKQRAGCVLTFNTRQRETTAPR